MIKNIFKNKWFFRLIGIAIFAFILVYKIDLKETLSVFQHLNPFYLFSAIIIMIIASTIKPYRWQYILKTIGINYSFWKTYKLYFIGLFMGIITPARLGEAGKILYLKKDRHPLDKSLISIVIDRFADITYLISFGFIGLFFFFYLFKNLIISVAIIAVVGAILFLLIIKNKGAKIILKKAVFFLAPAKYKQKLQKSFSEFIKILKLYKLKNYFAIFIITIFCWLPSYVAVYFLAKSVGITRVSFLYLAVSITVTSLITLLPISISGIGTRETVLLLLLIPFSISSEQIVSFSLLIFLTNFIIIPLIGFYCWLINPLPTHNK
jgi:uncharacterized protein (TIRG00374 family)